MRRAPPPRWLHDYRSAQARRFDRFRRDKAVIEMDGPIAAERGEDLWHPAVDALECEVALTEVCAAPPGLYFDIAASAGPDAGAWKGGTDHFVVITSGLIHRLYRLFKNLLKLIDSEGTLAGMVERSGRAACARYLLRLALRFAVAHELGHILLGHVGLRAAEGLPPLLEMSGRGDADGDDGDVRQALELDTDILGLQAILRGELSARPIHARAGVDLLGTEEILAATLFAASTVFFLMAGEDLDRESFRLPPVSHHPHPMVRLKAAEIVLLSMATREGVARPDLNLALRDALLVEAISRTVTDSELLAPPTWFARADKLLEEYTRLRQAAARLAPALEPHEYLDRSVWDGPGL